mgnify:CR=1 FL=1
MPPERKNNNKEILEEMQTKARAQLEAFVSSGEVTQDVLDGFNRIRFGQMTYPPVPDVDILLAVLEGDREKLKFMIEERLQGPVSGRIALNPIHGRSQSNVRR